MVYLENSTSTCGGGAEAFMEIQKAWHSLDNAENASSMSSAVYNVRDLALTNSPWTEATDDAAGIKLGSVNGFCIALELESFAQKSDVLLSGLNTLTSQVFFEFNVVTAATKNTAWTFDFFANYDQIMVLQDGLLSVRF